MSRRRSGSTRRDRLDGLGTLLEGILHEEQQLVNPARQQVQTICKNETSET